MRKIKDFILDLLLAISLDALILMGTWIVYTEWFSTEAQNEKIQKMYRQIVAVTGQTQDALPLVISEASIENAYNDGTKIVIYKGLINNTSSWDEVAMILGHEVAHGMLGHLDESLGDLTPNQIAVLEGNADKMGAVYMMKAGWDVCKGRQLFKHWKEKHGNALGQDHPDYSYRFDELDINCGDK